MAIILAGGVPDEWYRGCTELARYANRSPCDAGSSDDKDATCLLR
jgi:hypothetical protein